MSRETSRFFNFLQQQGYLRVWIDGEIVRVDAESKIKRLGARVQVIQDRIAISEENRTRLTEAIEIALRFGKDGSTFVDSRFQTEHPIPSPPAGIARIAISIFARRRPGLFSFNNPLGACPECRGFGRTIAIDLNARFPIARSRIAQGAVRVFRGEEMGESQKDLLRACAREEIDVHLPFEELPKADQDFVINGEKRTRRSTPTTITKTIAGTACADFSNGSRARPTKCMCASCSAAIALTPPARAATAGVFSPRR